AGRIGKSGHQGTMVAKISRQIYHLYPGVTMMDVDRQIETVIRRPVIDENDLNRQIQVICDATSLQIEVTDVLAALVKAGADRKLDLLTPIRPEPRDVHTRCNQSRGPPPATIAACLPSVCRRDPSVTTTTLSIAGARGRPRVHADRPYHTIAANG